MVTSKQSVEDHPSISVIIPSYNQGEFIEETILSVLGQNYPKLEVIVIDGGSTDNTVEILQQYSHQLTYWHSKPDLGQADAINQGMRMASGEILCWLNSDDMYMPGALLEIGHRFVGRTSQYYLVYGAAVTIKQGETMSELETGMQSASPFDAPLLAYFDFIVQPSTFWTRKLWDAVGELDLNYHYVLDWDWFVRASKLTEFEYIPKFYSIYRFHSSHKTSTGGERRRKEILEVVTKYAVDYWAELFIEVDRSYPQVAEYLYYWKLPKRQLLLPLFFPKIAAKLAKIQDLYFVLATYGYKREQ